MKPRFFFAQDDDGHWYMVPAEHRAEWYAWAGVDFDWESSEWSKFAQAANEWRLGGGIGRYTSTDPEG